MAEVLIADDAQDLRELFGMVLRDMGHTVTECKTASETLDQLRMKPFDLLMLDMQMPEREGGVEIPEIGLQVIKDISEFQQDLDVIVITAYGTVSNAVEAMKGGVKDFLTKPVDLDELQLKVERAVEYREQAKALIRNTFVGESQQMQELGRLIRRYAADDATVLIRGERGTGKELVARAIHTLSPRRNGGLVIQNCAELQSDLSLSTLFGHKRGSFTGATIDRIGKIQAADGGTFFLDELGKLPLEQQAIFNRVLEEKEVSPIGENFPHTVDVRFIAATNRDLKDMMARDEFLEDLFERLNVLPLEIPPLKERKDDIPLLVNHFIETFNREKGKCVEGIRPDALGYMMEAYPWPGNVRELRNVIERAFVVIDRDWITREDIRLDNAGSADDALNELFKIPKDIPMKEIELRAVLETLEATDGNREEAARRLHISPGTVYAYLKLVREDPRYAHLRERYAHVL